MWKGLLLAEVFFYLAILQGIVEVKHKLWGFKSGWFGSLHDWYVFQITKVGRTFMKGKYMPHKLIGNTTDHVRPWVHCPFKGEKRDLIQHSSPQER